MSILSTSVLGAVCASAAFAVVEPVEAQVYYSYPVSTQPLYALPSPNYVVYSPTFMAWRSAGYYGGNWGPYYYAPEALYPVIPGNAIWPTSIPATPPVAWPVR